MLSQAIIRWAFSFALAAWFMRVMRVGWLPVLAAGLLTLGITIAWCMMTDKRRPPAH